MDGEIPIRHGAKDREAMDGEIPIRHGAKDREAVEGEIPIMQEPIYRDVAKTVAQRPI